MKVAQNIGNIATLTTKANSISEFPIVSLVAVENNLWRRFEKLPPQHLESFKSIYQKNDTSKPVIFPSTGGHVFLMIKSNHVDPCHALKDKILEDFGADNIAKAESYLGYRHGGKDLSGFIDGTRNPDHLLR